MSTRAASAGRALPDALRRVGAWWAVSTIYAGFTKPLHVGPVPVRVNLFIFVAPFLLLSLGRLRAEIRDMKVQRDLSVTLALGLAAYAMLVLGTAITLVIGSGLYVAALVAFEAAMGHLAAQGGAEQLAHRWGRLLRMTLLLAIGGLAAAGTVATFGASKVAGIVVAVAIAFSGAVVLMAVVMTGGRTQAWLREIGATGTTD